MRRPPQRGRRGPVAAGRPVQYVVQAPPAVTPTLSDAELEAYLELVDAEMEESEALEEGELFGGTKWKKKHAAAKTRRKKAEAKLKAYKERRAAKKAEKEAQAAEAQVKEAEEAEQAEAESSSEPAPEPSMEDAPQESSAEVAPERPTAAPAEDPSEAAELEAWMAQAAQEDAEDQEYEGDFGYTATDDLWQTRPPDVLDVFARRLASSLPAYHQHVPMQHGGLSEPGDHQHLVTPRGIHKTYAPDLETHLSETDELVDQIRESFSLSRW
ncbi:hypothetical protein CMI47_01065 [Candidatus Pacearchaeota archaeon]|nr:hypothetical protein [Candidatus Pacearchaeota archaeon]